MRTYRLGDWTVYGGERAGDTAELWIRPKGEGFEAVLKRQGRRTTEQGAARSRLSDPLLGIVEAVPASRYAEDSECFNEAALILGAELLRKAREAGSFTEAGKVLLDRLARLEEIDGKRRGPDGILLESAEDIRLLATIGRLAKENGEPPSKRQVREALSIPYEGPGRREFDRRVVVLGFPWLPTAPGRPAKKNPDKSTPQK